MSQLLLPERMGFQVSPGIMSVDTLLRKLYPPERGPYMFRRGPGISGLGCNPGETRDVAGGQQVCGDDGKSWSAAAAPPPPVVAAPPVTFTPPVQPTNEVCQPWDTPCVERNMSLQLGYQVQVGEAGADQDYEQCIANGTDSGTCRARWPVGYSGNVPFMNLTPAQQTGALQSPEQADATLAATNAAQAANLLAIGAQVTKANQSVPPTTPLTPMTTGFQNTGKVVAQQLGQGTANPPAQTPASDSSSTLLIVAAVGVGLFLLMKGGKS